jgi:hypothetical protein
LALVLVIGLVGGGLALFLSGGVSKADFIQDADAICRATQVDAQTLTETTDPTAPAQYYEGLAALLERQTDDIRALEAPTDDKEVLDEWLVTQDALAGAFAASAGAAAGGDVTGSDEAFENTTEIQIQSNELASSYGFVVCGIISPS